MVTQNTVVELEILEALGAIVTSASNLDSANLAGESLKKPNKKPNNKQNQKFPNSKKLISKNKEKLSELENLLDSEGIDLDSDSTISSDSNSIIPLISEMMDYSSLAQQFHFEQVHYSELDSSYLPKSTIVEAKYKEWEAETEYLMEGSETMDEVEAQDTIQEVIYAAILGGGNVSLEKRQRLDNWIKFNPSEFALYKETAVVRSDNVNYAV